MGNFLIFCAVYKVGVRGKNKRFSEFKIMAWKSEKFYLIFYVLVVSLSDFEFIGLLEEGSQVCSLVIGISLLVVRNKAIQASKSRIYCIFESKFA